MATGDPSIQDILQTIKQSLQVGGLRHALKLSQIVSAGSQPSAVTSGRVGIMLEFELAKANTLGQEQATVVGYPPRDKITQA